MENDGKGEWKRKMKESNGRGKERKGKGEGIIKIAFWNVAGLKNKDKEFWKGIREWDVVILMETWVDRKGWEKIAWRMPKEYNWEMQ